MRHVKMPRTHGRGRPLLVHALAALAALASVISAPALIAVDFWRQGDVVGAARELNGLD